MDKTIKTMAPDELLKHERYAVIRHTNGEFTRCVSVFVSEGDATAMADSLNSAERTTYDETSYEVVEIGKGE